MLQNIILHSSRQSATIQTPDTFQSIQLVNIFSNEQLQGPAPKGLRFSLKNDCEINDCFSFQRAGKLYFNCFEIMSQFDGCNSSTLLNELTISCEGIEFLSTTEINITIHIL
jgi:hypothetical protein